ncbi:polysaccharide deacetylase family protein [Geomicrobium sp. JCM 19055]|uniref:polysaccharide deacetylase family protein n=1 Tax=Geomicrobium sp. JCM 19055 TaxID=1460649 RepID=UPI00045ED758|nr:polysaccharide deacetylase family protein [Geomicrobium sp. JCM 19055]GAK01108.1 polysaccharide deacetylase [Geomicrobium sp. JCM 19055]
MAQFYVVNRRGGKKYLFIAMVAFCTACILLMDRPFLAVFSGQDGSVAFSSADIDDEKTSLTFNVSWGEANVEPILDILEDKNVDATFFVSGVWSERHLETLQRMIDDGHEVGNYGYRFKPYPDQEIEEMRRDMLQGHESIKDAIGEAPVFFRPPAGIFNQDVLDAAENLGYSVIHWATDGKDWQNPGVDEILANIQEELSPGDVIMLDASDSAKQTVEALPLIIDELQDANYEFVSLEMLISGAEASYEEM